MNYSVLCAVRNFEEFFDSLKIKLRNSVKFRGIPSITDFRKIRIPQKLIFDGIMDTLCAVRLVKYIKQWYMYSVHKVYIHVECEFHMFQVPYVCTVYRTYILFLINRML